MAGKTITLIQKPDTTVHNLKMSLMSYEGILPEYQKLFFEGSVLEDDNTLSHYNIKKESELQMAQKRKLHTKTFGFHF